MARSMAPDLIDLTDALPVDSFALFANGEGAFLLTYKPKAGPRAMARALHLLPANDGLCVLVLGTDAAPLMLGPLEPDLAAGLAEAGAAHVLCADAGGQRLDYEIPLHGLAGAPARGSTDDDEIGAFLVAFMASGARSQISPGAGIAA